MSETAKKTDNKVEHKFSKEQWLKSLHFADKPDYVMAALDKNVEYSLKEAEKAIEVFIKGGI